jgi:hypothetical protein
LGEGKGRSDLPIETIRRLTCDGSIVRMTDGVNGEPLDVGRKQRIVPVAIRRALIARDGGCSFPGCTRRHFVDAHHVRHWSQGGETSLANTLLLCSAHHRLVHEDGYTIHRDERDRWYFRRPDGRAIPEHGYRPEDMHDDERRHLRGNVERARAARALSGGFNGLLAGSRVPHIGSTRRSGPVAGRSRLS